MAQAVAPRPRRSREKYVIGGRRHINELGENALWEVGLKLSEEDPRGKSWWRLLLKAIGLRHEDTGSIRSSTNPGYEVIRVWSEQPESTIRVLKRLLKVELHRPDLADMINKARQSNLIYLTVTLVFEGRTIHDLSGRCESEKKIVDFVRPQLKRKLGLEQIHQQHRRVVIRMFRSGEYTWTSPAKSFQGRQVTLEKTYLKVRKERSEKAKRLQRQPTVERNAMSECDEDIIFEMVDCDASDLAAGNLSSSSSTSASSNEDVAAEAEKQAAGAEHHLAMVATEHEDVQLENGQGRLITEEQNANATSSKVVSGL